MTKILYINTRHKSATEFFKAEIFRLEKDKSNELLYIIFKEKF